MYYYLYDSFLSDSKYEKTIDKIRTRFLDLEIQGRPGHLSLLKSARELIEDEIRNGVNTVIVVGNDNTFLKVINVIAKHDLTLGIIPIGDNNKIAESLGIPPEELACDTLAARKVEKVDLGVANDVYFFSDLKIEKDLGRISLKRDGFKIVPQRSCQSVQIYNFCYEQEHIVNNRVLKKINPADGLLDLVVVEKSILPSGIFRKKNGSQKFSNTIMPAKHFEIASFEYLPVKLDKYYVLKTPVKVSVAEKKLKIIVGKNRKF
ncbi:MAG: diacylglycerol/lipid kinase family protein [Patescibacteria group bacterium]